MDYSTVSSQYILQLIPDNFPNWQAFFRDRTERKTKNKWDLQKTLLKVSFLFFFESFLPGVYLEWKCLTIFEKFLLFEFWFLAFLIFSLEVFEKNIIQKNIFFLKFQFEKKRNSMLI